jgi:hypothetical protein
MEEAPIMEDQNQGVTPGATGDRPDLRQEERMRQRQDRIERRSRRHPSWMWGGVLIVLGLALLLENMGLTLVANWWALFILIPAFGALAAAWDQYRDNQRLTRGAAGSLVGGMLLTILTLVFLFSIDFGLLWPALLVLAGLALLSVGLIPA